MVSNFFTSVLDMSVSASVVILVVLLARLLLRKVPKIVSYGLWLVVLVRLLCPFELQSPVSIMPEIAPVSSYYEPELSEDFFIDPSEAVGAVDPIPEGSPGVQQVPVVYEGANIKVDYVSVRTADPWVLAGTWIWLLGFCAMAVYSAASILLLKRKVREAVLLEKGVYETDGIGSPFVMGLFIPKIYLPVGLTQQERNLILAHERQHIRRMDPVWKALGFLALSIHWFNPLVWVAFILGCRDMEMSCDEAVLKKLGPMARGDYAAALLKITVGKRMIAGSPLAFGEGDPKGRIRNLAKWKKPVLWISILAVALCAVLAVCLLTDPMQESTPGGSSYYFGYLDAVEGDTLTLTCEDGRELVFERYSGFSMPDDVKPGAYVMLRGSWNSEKQCYVTANVRTITGPVHTDLEDAIENAVLLIGGDPKEEGEYACASFIAIAREPEGRLPGDTSDGVITLYGMALHQTYANQNGTLVETGGSHIPVAITFHINSMGGYCLAEYWMPRDGSYYDDDVRGKFPDGMIPNTQEYIVFQQKACEEKAMRHFGITESGEEESTVPPTTEATSGFDLSLVPEDGSLPFEELPETYSREDAIADGVAVMEYENAYANAEVWEAFARSVEEGNPARVRIMDCRLGFVQYMEDILFDGTSFMVRTTVYDTEGHLAEIKESYYNYLLVYRVEKQDEKGWVYERYVRYGLCNAQPPKEPNWYQWHDGSGKSIIVFQYITQYSSNPELPETLVSAQLMHEDAVYGTITDPEKLESLRTMLAGAQVVRTATQYFVRLKLYMRLEFSDGTQMEIPMTPTEDWIIIDGNVYDYGPGDVIRNGQATQYNAILDLVRHFGLEDWPEAFTQWCIDHGIEPPRHSLKVIVGEEPHP